MPDKAMQRLRAPVAVTAVVADQGLAQSAAEDQSGAEAGRSPTQDDNLKMALRRGDHALLVRCSCYLRRPPLARHFGCSSSSSSSSSRPSVASASTLI